MYEHRYAKRGFLLKSANEAGGVVDGHRTARNGEWLVLDEIDAFDGPSSRESTPWSLQHALWCVTI